MHSMLVDLSVVAATSFGAFVKAQTAFDAEKTA